jgi:hypothetical protein
VTAAPVLQLGAGVYGGLHQRGVQLRPHDHRQERCGRALVAVRAAAGERHAPDEVALQRGEVDPGGRHRRLRDADEPAAAPLVAGQLLALEQQRAGAAAGRLARRGGAAGPRRRPDVRWFMRAA